MRVLEFGDTWVDERVFLFMDERDRAAYMHDLTELVAERLKAAPAEVIVQAIKNWGRCVELKPKPKERP